MRSPASIKLVARDGFPIGATIYEPVSAPRAIAIIAPAMAVLQRMYRAFAAFLASKGIAALTFDYRGIGESAPPRSLRGFDATVSDWAQLDLVAVIDHMRERFGGAPCFVIGHSIGGQILGLCPRAPSLKGAVLVAAQSGYWKNWRGVGRALMFTHWHVMPLIARAAGFLPMRAARQGENVPLGAALEWARWGRHPDYVLSSPSARHRELSIPMRSYSISDDIYAPPDSVHALERFYSAAKVESKVLTPAALGTRRIGHFGIFRREFKGSFYEDVASWVLA